MALQNYVQDIESAELTLMGPLCTATGDATLMRANVDENPWGTGYKVLMRKLNCFRKPAKTSAAKS